jgi:hypothetical protein
MRGVGHPVNVTLTLSLGVRHKAGYPMRGEALQLLRILKPSREPPFEAFRYWRYALGETPR